MICSKKALKRFFITTLGLMLLTSPAAAQKKESALDLNTLTTLDLASAKAIAIQGNPSLQATRTRIEQAFSVVSQKKAAWMPSVDASASLARVDSSANSGTADENERYASSLSASLTLFDGFNRTYSLASAKYAESSATEAEKEARRLLLFNVSQGYFTLQSAMENLAIAESDREYNTRLLTEAQAKYDAGAGTMSDVLNFKIAVNNAKTSLTTTRREISRARVALAVLMGAEQARLPDGLSLAPLPEQGPWSNPLPLEETLKESALSRRPDLAQAELSIKQADAAIKVAQSGYYPTVDLTGSLSGNRDGSATFEQDDFGSSVGVNVSFNLFSGGQTRAKVAENRAALREAQYTRQSTTLAIKQEVADAMATFTAAKEAVVLQKETVAFTSQSRGLVEQEYLAGTSTVVKLNEAQNNLVAAQGNLVTARVALVTAWESIQKVTGLNLTE